MDLEYGSRNTRMPTRSTIRSPAPVVRGRVERSTAYEPLVDIPHLVNGYYGKPKSYVYSNYYGTSPERIFERLPYACGRYGYC
jgi:hypothetical protein